MISRRKATVSPYKNIGDQPSKEEESRGLFHGFFRSDKSVKLFSIFTAVMLLVVVGLSASQLPRLNSEYSFDQFFPVGHPLLAQSAQIRRTFQLQDRSAFFMVLEKPEGAWLEKKSLAKLKDLTDNIAQSRRVQSVVSIANVEGALNVGSDLAIGPVFEKLPEKDWSSYSQANPLLKSQLISEDQKSILVLIYPNKTTPARLQQLAESLPATAKKYFPRVHVQVGGPPAIQGQFSKILFRELKVFFLLSLLIFCGVFLLFFRGFSAFSLTVVSLLVSNTVVIGALAYLNIPFSVLLSTLPIIVSIALISLMIHSLHRWAEVLEADRFLSASRRFRKALAVLREMALPNFLGSVTTAIGFATLCFTDIPLIRQYGWVVAVSVMVAWLFTQVMLLGFMAWTRPELRTWAKAKSYWTLPILRRSAPVFLSILGISMGLGILGKGISFSGRLFDDLPRGESARRTTEKIDQKFGGAVAYDLILKASPENFWKNPENLKRLEQAIGAARQLPEVGSALSLTSFFDRKIPQSSGEVSELVFLYSMAENNPLVNYLTEDGKGLRVAFRLHDLPGLQIERARNQIKALVQQAFGATSLVVQEAGVATISHTINQEVAKGLIGGFWHSLVIIGVLLMFIFRSLRWGLVACLPNLIPPAVLLGALAIFKTPIKPGVALIFSIALGLAFNNTVYLLSRLKGLMKQKKMSVLPLKRALLQEGNPCFFETLIMFFGFLIFLSSRFGVNQTFGLYMLLSIIAGAVADLIFLPALLRLFPEVVVKRKKTNSSSSTNQVQKVAAAILLGLLVISPRSLHAQTAPEILGKVRKQIEAKDDQAKVQMKIIEANGEIKTRDLKLQTLRRKKFYALARIQSPADIKGTGFLVTVTPKQQDQWLYLPSNKQVRRVVGAKKTAGILGSELTIEDLNPVAIQSSTVQLLKKTPREYLLQILIKPGTSIYSKVLLSISTQDFVPLRTEYYQKDVLKKTVEFLKYKKLPAGIFRAQEIQVKNRANRRGTNIELSDLQVNTGLSEEDFSVNALKPD